MPARKDGGRPEAALTVQAPNQAMAAGDKSRPWSRLQTIAAGIGALLMVGVVSLAAYNIRDGYQGALGKGEQTAENLARVIEAQTRHAFVSAELSLNSIGSALRLMPPGRPSRAADLHALMKAAADDQPHVRAIFVTDENGVMIHDSDSLPASPRNFSDREYFRVHRDHPDYGLYIGPLLVSRTTDKTFISMSRRISKPDGTFGGVVVAVLEPEYFQNFYSTVDTGEGGSVALFLREGTLLFRGPPAPQAAGKSFLDLDLFSERVSAAPSGTYHAKSAIDGMARVFSYRVVDGLPLVVLVGISEQQVLAGWYRSIKTTSVLTLVVVLALMALTWRLVREIGRREALAASLREGEQRYRYLFEAHPHPMWIYDAATLTFLAVNDAVVRNYGYSREEFLAMTARDIRPPEEVPRLERLMPTLGPTLNLSGVWRHRKKDGTVFEVDVISHGFDFNGRPARLVQAQDVSVRLRAERELRESEERYRGLFEGNPLPVWVMDEETLRFLAVNQAAIDKYGYTREEFLSLTIADMQVAEDRARVIQQIRNRDAGTIAHYLRRHVTKGGQIIEAEVTAHPFMFGDRQARMILVNDVTEQRRAQQALRDSERRYRYLFESSPLPMWVRENGTLRFLAVNNATVAAYGYSREEFLSMTVADLRLPEDVPGYLEIARARDPMSDSHDVVRHRRKDGTVLDVEITSRPFEFDGQLVRLTLVNDITEKLRAERALQESERRYRDLFDLNPSPMWVYDIETLAILAVNESAVQQYGYSREEFAAMTVPDLHMQQDVPALLERLRQRDPGARFVRHVRHRRKDGTVMDVEIKVGPIAFGGRVVRLVLCNDISERKGAEAALRESEERFRATFEQAAVGMALRGVDPRNPRWLRVNQKLCDILGYTREELLQLSSVDVTPPEDRDEAIDYNEQLLQGKITSYSREKRYVRKDGQIIWVNLSLSTVHGPDDRPLYVISVIQDITRRRRAEAEQRKLAAIVESSQEAIVSRALDGTVLSWNAGAEKIFGYSAAEMVGRSISLLSPPEHRHESRRNTAMLLKGRTVPPFETVRIAKDGHPVHVQISVSPIHDTDGSIHAISAIFRDITDRKKAEEALARERTLLRAVIDSLPEHIYVKDRERRYLLINKAWLAARGMASRDAMAGTTVFDYFPPERAAQYDAEDCSVIETGKPLIGREQVNMGADGQKQWYLTTKVPLRDPAGNIIGIIGINHDITALQQSAEVISKLNVELEQRVIERTAQLQAANRELESFAYSVSHDLRAPLRSIDGFSRALLDDYQGKLDATGQDYLRRVRAASQRMATLIDDLLALSRVTRSEMRCVTTDLSALAHEIVADLRREQPERGGVDIRIARGIQVQGDPSLLRAALDNLLRNAWKFTARQPEVRIEVGVEQNEGRSIYFVRDNGVGFDMKYAGKLFGAFQRLHSDADFPGTGIGLATVHRIIRRHGGEIWAEAAVGKGAVFFFTLGSGVGP